MSDGEVEANQVSMHSVLDQQIANLPLSQQSAQKPFEKLMEFYIHQHGESITKTQLALFTQLSRDNLSQVSLNFQLQQYLITYMEQIWDAIFYSVYTHGCLTEYKQSFLLQEPFGWIFLHRKVQESLNQAQEVGTHWAQHNQELTEEDQQLFKLCCDLYDIAMIMTEEEEGRMVVASQ